MDGAALSSAIQSTLSAGWSGTQLTNFCNAIGMGVVGALKGSLTFTTADVGTVPGTGIGSGSGIKGMNVSNISSLIYSTGNGAWASQQRDGPGVEWMNFCTKVATAINTHLMSTAILTSTHTPVFAGVGTVLAYSGVTASAVKSSIIAAAPGSWASTKFPDLANAVATGLMTELLGHSPIDTVTIVGSPTGSPSPGSGSGSGIVT